MLINWDIASFEFLVDTCWNIYDPPVDEFRDSVNVSLYKIMEFCDEAGTVGFGEYLEEAEVKLYNHYNCSTNFTKCTKHNFAVK